MLYKLSMEREKLEAEKEELKAKLTRVEQLACFWGECLLHGSRTDETELCMEDLHKILRAK